MAALVLEDAVKVFGAGAAAVRAVAGVSMAVDPGEVVLVMGPSGSGKTTLLAIAGCLMRPDSGNVVLAGRDVTALGEGDLPAIRRQHIGFIFQSFNLMSALTARENVELVLSIAGQRGGRARAGELLQELGLGQRGSHLPAQLSGGEKQRVAIARALATDPTLILADEPTANLDSRSGGQVMSLLAHAARERGKAVIIVSHDTRLREIASRVLWMEDGRLVAAAAGGPDATSGGGDRRAASSEMSRAVSSDQVTRGGTKMACDPVCGMEVFPEKAPAKVEHGGETYYFCCPHCARAFSQDPARYTGGSDGSGGSGGSGHHGDGHDTGARKQGGGGHGCCGGHG